MDLSGDGTAARELPLLRIRIRRCAEVFTFLHKVSGSFSVCLHLNAEVTFVLFWRRTERLGSDDLNTRALYSHTEREQLRTCRVQDLTNTTKLLKNNISPRKLQQSKQNYPRPPAAPCTEQPGKIVQDTGSLHFSELFESFEVKFLILSFYSGLLFAQIYV